MNHLLYCNDPSSETRSLYSITCMYEFNRESVSVVFSLTDCHLSVYVHWWGVTCTWTLKALSMTHTDLLRPDRCLYNILLPRARARLLIYLCKRNRKYSYSSFYTFWTVNFHDKFFVIRPTGSTEMASAMNIYYIMYCFVLVNSALIVFNSNIYIFKKHIYTAKSPSVKLTLLGVYMGPVLGIM